jgi:hypothetical protein
MSQEILKKATLDPSFFQRNTAKEALGGFMGLHGNKFLKTANTKEKKGIEIKNKIPEFKKANVDKSSFCLFQNNVFAKIAESIHDKIKDGESARLKVIASDRCEQDPTGNVTVGDLNAISGTFQFFGKTASILRKVTEHADDPESYQAPKKEEEIRMASDKRENLIKTYCATTNSASHPYNKGIANIGAVEDKYAQYVKNKIASGKFNFAPEIGVTTEDLSLDSQGNIKNMSSTATIRIPKDYAGNATVVRIPLIVKEGSFEEPVIMANKEEIVPFDVMTLEKIYWASSINL